MLIDSPLLASQIEQAFDARIPQLAYRVQLSESGDLQWQSMGQGSATTSTVYLVEPGSSWLSRLFIRVLGTLPIEWLL